MVIVYERRKKRVLKKTLSRLSRLVSASERKQFILQHQYESSLNQIRLNILPYPQNTLNRSKQREIENKQFVVVVVFVPQALFQPNRLFIFYGYRCWWRCWCFFCDLIHLIVQSPMHAQHQTHKIWTNKKSKWYNNNNNSKHRTMYIE